MPLQRLIVAFVFCLIAFGTAYSDYSHENAEICNDLIVLKNGHNYRLETEFAAPGSLMSRAKLQNIEKGFNSIRFIIEGKVSTPATYFEYNLGGEYISFGSDANLLYIFEIKGETAQLVKKIPLEEPLVQAPLVSYQGSSRTQMIKARLADGSELNLDIQRLISN